MSTPANNPAKPTSTDSKAVQVKSDSGNSNSGKTTIEDAVVAKVVGIATREVPGVYALGGGAARAIGAIRDVVGNTDLTQGVSVEVGEKQAAVDITLVVEYPSPLKGVADQVRSAVYNAVEKLVGLDVVEVNITVSDIHIPSDDKNTETQESAKAIEGSRVE
ncbi:Asp23/Gls24 family envelope stress response protein [Psychromicrobium lacuslunae]|uniref:Stress protein n=1 Tax=Psychromicrobium lacuslunae TaxID=1618207 RepID=A0A0D4C3N8_9MICC|nr:Asp23/Gls24 family envelope stress response protein [Psychromicrobium lacuslunae]AJT43213.1 stress protein [Psychromicrobium lacuslunae]